MSESMTVDRAIELVKKFGRGPMADIFRQAACVLADEVEQLQARVAELEAEKWNAQIAEAALLSVEKERDTLETDCDHANSQRAAAEQERDELRRRVAEMDRYQVQSIANRICGEIPERFHIEMVLENGAGWVSLFHDGKPVDIDMADWNIAEQFDVAMQCVTEYANQIEGGA